MTDASVPVSLARLIGAAHVLTAPDATAPYYTDWVGRTSGAALCVCRPGSVDEVAAIVRYCAGAAIPVFPQGGNTSSTAGGIPLCGGRGVVLCLARLNKIEEVDTVSDAIIVQAGCTLAQVQQAAKDHDRLFPLTLSSEGSCQIGGNVSTNAGGTAVLRYGNTRDLVLGIEAVLADGRIWNGLRTLRKDNAGYDMKSIFVGSEGTLGIVTRVALKLFPRQRQRAMAFVALPAPQAAVDLLLTCRASFGAELDAFELFSASQLRIIAEHIPGVRLPFAALPDWALMIEVKGNAAFCELSGRLVDVLGGAMTSGLITNAVPAATEAQANAFWHIRHSVSEANKQHGLNFTHDTAVPIVRVPDFLAAADAAVTQAYPEATLHSVSHLGDGNVHFTAIFPHGQAGNAGNLGGEVARLVHDIAVSMGGTFAAEHGIGQRYRDSLQRYKSPVELDLFRKLKTALDPQGILNPGKVL